MSKFIILIIGTITRNGWSRHIHSNLICRIYSDYNDHFLKMKENLFIHELIFIPTFILAHLREYLKLVASLKYDERPNYKKMRSLFSDGLSKCGFKDDDVSVCLPSKKPSPQVFFYLLVRGCLVCQYILFFVLLISFIYLFFLTVRSVVSIWIRRKNWQNERFFQRKIAFEDLLCVAYSLFHLIKLNFHFAVWTKDGKRYFNIVYIYIDILTMQDSMNFLF